MQAYAVSLGICENKACGALLRLDADYHVYNQLAQGKCATCDTPLSEDSFGVRRIPNGYVKIRWVVRAGYDDSRYEWSEQKPTCEFKLCGMWIVPDSGPCFKEITVKNESLGCEPKTESHKAAVLSFDPEHKSNPVETEIAVATFLRHADLCLALCQPWIEMVDKEECPLGYSLHRNGELLAEFLSEEMKEKGSAYAPKENYFLCVIDKKTFEEMHRLGGNGFFVPSGGLPPRYVSPKKTNVVHVRFGK